MYRLGLDIGTTSVGWAVLNTDIDAEPNRIIDLGVRIFDFAENPKDGSSLALPRRQARSARRLTRRRKHRIDRIKSMIVNSGIVGKEELNYLFPDGEKYKRTGTVLKDIYRIRAEALDRLLNEEELARLLVHLAQRRGFKSNRENSDGNDKEAGKLLKATDDNKKHFEKEGYRTIGEMLYKDEKYTEIKRNKGGDYSNTFLRRQIEDEVDKIFAAQKEFANPYTTDEFCEKYKNILFSQRAFDEGPGEGSPYGGNMIEKMVGECTFEKGEKRAPKASYTFEYFNLCQKINHISLYRRGEEKQKLTAAQRQLIIDLCHKKAAVDYSSIRDALGLKDEYSILFGDLSYGDKAPDKVEKKTKFNYLKAYHEMRKAFDKLNKGYISGISVERRDLIATALTYYKTDDKIQQWLSDADFSKEELEVIINKLPNFSGFGNLSAKAMKKITPYLEQGLTYDKACESAGYDFRAHTGDNRGKYLPSLSKDTNAITNPTVKRAINQTIKVVNAIVKKYGPPAMVNIELARELSKSFSERKEIEKQQKDNAENNRKVIREIKETFGISNPKGQDVLKYRLWNDQQQTCLYTNEPIEAERLFEQGYCEIDHIVPYSVSFNDSYNNKVLVKTYANREKGNRVPLEYIRRNAKLSEDDFVGLVNAFVKNRAKRDNLLMQRTPFEDNDLKDRSLNDTKYITSFMAKHIRDNLEFDKTCDKKQRVISVNGAVTRYMRTRWGLNKLRENGDRHHALDAVVVACVSQGMVKQVSDYSRRHEGNLPSDKEKFPAPWPHFKDEVDARTNVDPFDLLSKMRLPNYQDIDIREIKPVFVSRMQRKKSTGQAHKETIRAERKVNGENVAVVKTNIQDLKLDKDGEIAGYYNPSSDAKLYRLLKEKLTAAGGKGKDAFPEGFVYKPTPKGGQRPKVSKVKTYKPTTLNVSVNKGIADNGNMVRIDLYKVEGEGYYFVPVYVADLIKPKLPNKACVRFKDYENWKVMDEKDFLFSVYPNDLLYIKRAKPIKFNKSFKNAALDEIKTANEVFVYYKSTNIHTASILVINDDNSYYSEGLGLKTIESIEKYHVDVLGNRYKAGKEKRQR